MRVFIALELPEVFAGQVADLARQLAATCGGRFVPAQNYHLTLAFIGEVGEAEARDAMAAVDAACAGAGPVLLEPAGLGTFKGEKNLHMRIAPDPELVRLQARVVDELEARGLSFDRKPFVPHVTLARRARLPEGALGELAFPESAEAVEVTLFRSILEPTGARYKPLYTVTLG